MLVTFLALLETEFLHRVRKLVIVKYREHLLALREVHVSTEYLLETVPVLFYIVDVDIGTFKLREHSKEKGLCAGCTVLRELSVELVRTVRRSSRKYEQRIRNSAIHLEG